MIYRICSLIAFSLLNIQIAFADLTPSEIKTILQNRIETEKRGVGIVVGIIDKSGRTVVSHGKLTKGGNQPVDENTVFEIGSVTKVFTAALLMDMVSRGKLNLDDPIAKHLPRSVKAPTRNNEHITLQHLITHTSGLPRLPDNMDIKNSDNPYASYTQEQMYAFLSNHTLQQDIGKEFVYSNYGAGLLGNILAHKAGTDYETLLINHICKPLGMVHTAITLSPNLKSRLATGHNLSLNPVSNWDLPALAGAGAIRSTVQDMLTFLAANLNLKASALNEILSNTHVKRHPTGKDRDVALGWQILKKYEPEIIWHNGGTGGYRSFIGFDKQNGFGVAVLSNSSNSVDDIGFHILNTQFKLSKPKPKSQTEHVEIEFDPTVFDMYVGEYELTPSILFTITRENNAFFVQLTGQGKIRIYPESETKFFLKVVDAQITFFKNDAGEVTHLELYQNKTKQRAVKKGMTLESDQTEIKLSAEVLSRYVGRYQIQPGVFITVTQDSTQLKARLSGQQAIEIYPESETKFFYKVVDAQISFGQDSTGKVTDLTLHQAGRDIPASKVE